MVYAIYENMYKKNDLSVNYISNNQTPIKTNLYIFFLWKLISRIFTDPKKLFYIRKIQNKYWIEYIVLKILISI